MPKSSSFFSIRREVYSRVSADSTSTFAPGSSSRCSGGSGESGRSSNSGFCRSRLTRSDLGMASCGGSMWMRQVLVELLLLLLDRLPRALRRACSPMRRSRAACQRARSACPAALDPSAQALGNVQPRHPAEQAEADAGRRTAAAASLPVKPRKPVQRRAERQAEHAAGLQRQCRVQAVQAQRFEAAAGQQQREEPGRRRSRRSAGRYRPPPSMRR